MSNEQKDNDEDPKIGAPLSDIDVDYIEELVKAKVPLEDIAELVGCCRKTLYNRQDAQTIIKRTKATMKWELKTAQWNKAVKDKDSTMLIWLGKNLLGQSDKPDIADPEDKDIKITFVNKLSDRTIEKVESGN